MKKISIVSSCYNEEDNIIPLIDRVFKATSGFQNYEYEFILIDNGSTDNTANMLRLAAKNDKRVKVIINTRNFGWIRSPYYVFLQGTGDAVIGLSSDLQDPPELIPQFIVKWENGAKIVGAVKMQSDEHMIRRAGRRLFYRLLSSLSEVNLINDFSGFGLYDKKVVDTLKLFNDPFPYFRGLIAETGYNIEKVYYKKPNRIHGYSKSNLLNLFDVIMLGLTSHSKIPLRMATLTGILLSILSFAVSIFYFVYKIIYWNSFALGLAPLIVGGFFLISIQMLFIGLIGEYILSLSTKVANKPLVIESERINFE
jgi:glycosyltransferase involved in cell wall biosynthesis